MDTMEKMLSSASSYWRRNIFTSALPFSVLIASFLYFLSSFHFFCCHLLPVMVLSHPAFFPWSPALLCPRTPALPPAFLPPSLNQPFQLHLACNLNKMNIIYDQHKRRPPYKKNRLKFKRKWNGSKMSEHKVCTKMYWAPSYLWMNALGAPVIYSFIFRKVLVVSKYSYHSCVFFVVIVALGGDGIRWLVDIFGRFHFHDLVCFINATNKWWFHDKFFLYYLARCKFFLTFLLSMHKH